VLEGSIEMDDLTHDEPRTVAFAAGDVRSGSAKRVASAVGEGSMAVSFVHAHIQRPV
jgi:thioredoxin reductase